MTSTELPKSDQINILVVDDSHSFRWVLRDIFTKIPEFNVVGEASNGIEALDLLIKLLPDVIIMDMEMPLMDGMTALQHLMIHTPTPTIMFSSLTKEGTTRSFDALKAGAVDFVYKDSFFQGQMLTSPQKTIVKKVVAASKLKALTVEPVAPEKMIAKKPTSNPVKIIFCEDCGNKVSITMTGGEEVTNVRCDNCGDHIAVNGVEQYKRNNFISVIGAGTGGYSNLLKLIPNLGIGLNGSVIIVMYGDIHHIDAFAEYLNSICTIKVVRVRDGITIDGGNCYIACGSENIYLKPHSAHFTLRSSQKYFPGMGPIDMTMSSIASIFKGRVAGFILSGNDIDGEKGFEAIKQNDGSIYVLAPGNCLHKSMGENIRKKCKVKLLENELVIAEKIKELHSGVSKNVFTM